MVESLQDLVGTQKLRDAWPKIESNELALKAAIETEEVARIANDNAHLTSTTAHNATAIVFTPGESSIIATSVDGAIKEQDARIDNLIINGDSGPEAADARVSAAKGKTFTVLKDRLEESEEDFIALQADVTSQGINVKYPFGNLLTPAKGDNITDDWAALQAIIDYAYDTGIGKVWFPKGNYLISKPLYLWGGLNYKDKGVTLEGVNLNDAKIIKNTHTGTSDGSIFVGIDAILMLAARDKSVAVSYNVKISNLSLSGLNGDSTFTDYGVYVFKKSALITMQNLWIGNIKTTCNINSGTWQSSFKNIFTIPSETGIYMGTAGNGSTSNLFESIYVYGASVRAYRLTGTYSFANNLASDLCTGTCYEFYFAEFTVNGVGSESTGVLKVFDFITSKVNISSAFVMPNLTNTAASVISAAGSFVTFSDSTLGYNTTTGSPALGYLTNNGLAASVTFNDCDLGHFALGEPSENIENHVNFRGQFGNANSRELKSMSFLGYDRERLTNQYIDSYLASPKVRGKALFLDTLNSPNFDDSAVDRGFGQRVNKGDWFLINNPQKGGHAAYIVKNDTSIVHTSLGTISGVVGSVVTVTDLTLDSFAKDGTLWDTGRAIESSGGGTGTLTSVDYVAKTLTIATLTGTWGVGNTVRMPIRVFLRDCSFMVVPVIQSGLTSQRPTADRIAGQMYLDLTLTKPIWWTGSVWIDATGATV